MTRELKKIVAGICAIAASGYLYYHSLIAVNDYLTSRSPKIETQEANKIYYLLWLEPRAIIYTALTQ